MLQTLGVDASTITDAGATWTRLHARFGLRATVVDRYELEEHVAGTAPTKEDRARFRREVMAAHYPDLELLGPQRTDPILLVPYDETWAARFERWAGRVHGAVAPLACRVEHVGSTAVPGLPAKPVVDVQVSVPSVRDEAAFAPGIESLGLPIRAREDGHRYFRPAGEAPRTVQVHVCEAGGAWEREHLLFRDYLRAHEPPRAVYADLKTSLAARFRDDRFAYNEGKTAFILDALEDAEAWAAQTRWRP